MEATSAAERIVNVNVGILGHVDSGKTSLARSLSTLLSTAALDKHPQSTERGITLDLGFSAFRVDVPPSLSHLPCDKLQFTLVDCPGHASLIRTIIGGAQIIDLMLLVVDVTKGFQTQTAECLVVGEVSPTKKMVVVLNKTDLLPAATRKTQIDKMARRVQATMKGTKFEGAAIVATAAAPAGGEGAEGVPQLIDQLMLCARDLRRDPREAEAPFLFAVDHCFAVKGQGTVLTGTVLQGRVAVNDVVELPSLKTQKKVKSMQMFHQPVTSAAQGDRVGICVTQLDAKLVERGLLAAPGSVPLITAAVARVERIRFHKSKLPSKFKFHVTVGHTTSMAECIFFRLPANAAAAPSDAAAAVVAATAADPPQQAAGGAHVGHGHDHGGDGHACGCGFDFTREYLYSDELPPPGEGREPEGTSGHPQEPAHDAQYDGPYWALLTFSFEIVCPNHSLLIGSRLDFDVHTPSCRLAFHGRILSSAADVNDLTKSLKIFKVKTREGVIERVADTYSVIGRGLFKKETDISQFVGLTVLGPQGLVGTIQSSFGKSGKYKVQYKDALPQQGVVGSPLELHFKRFLFDKSKRMIQ